MEQALSPEILACAVGRWTRIWGDSMVTGTVSMLLYGGAGLLLLGVSRRTGRTDRWLWRACAFLFFLQVLNTHLDLHAFPAAFGNCLARAQGWYQDRGPVKLLGALLIGAAIAVVLIGATVAWWRSVRANALLVAGVAIALGFTLIKGTGLNFAEAVYNNRVGPFRWADLIEYSGILLAAIAGWRRLRLVRQARLQRREAAARACAPHGRPAGGGGPGKGRPGCR